MGGMAFPTALTATDTVIISPLSADVTKPTCVLSFGVTIFRGLRTIATPVSSMLKI